MSADARPSAWRTIGAIGTAIVAWLVGAFVSGALVEISEHVFTVLRPEIIDLWAAIVAGVVGVVAAKWGCDRFVRNYSSAAVFWAFLVIGVLASIAVSIKAALLRPAWDDLDVVIQSVVVVGAAYGLFFKERPGSILSH